MKDIKDYIVDYKTNFVLIPCDNNDEYGIDEAITHFVVELNRVKLLKWMIMISKLKGEKEFYEASFFWNDLVAVNIKDETIVNDKTEAFKYLNIKDISDIFPLESTTRINFPLANITGTCVDFKCMNSYNTGIEYWTSNYKIEEL